MTTRWTGSASRNSLARTAPSSGVAGGSAAGSASAAANPAAARRSRIAFDPRREQLDRLVGHGVEEPAAIVGQAAQDRLGEDARPAPYSRTRKRAGRSSARHCSSSARARTAPKIGWSSGAVRKSPVRRRPVVLRGVVAVLRIGQRELHEPGEGHRPVAGDLGADAAPRGRGPTPAAAGGPEGRGGARAGCPSAAAAHVERRAARPGPTRLWPPSRIGIGASRADRVSALSHGSRTRSGSRRSEANRSSGLGQRGFVRAEPVGHEHPAVDERRVAELGEPRAERVGPVAVQEEAQDGTRRASLRPGVREREAGAGAQAALLDERPHPAGGVPSRASAATPRSSGRPRPARPGGRRRRARWPAGARGRRGRRFGRRASPGRASSTSSGLSRSTWSRHRRRRSATAQPARSSSQRASALSPGRSGIGRRARPARAIAIASAE